MSLMSPALAGKFFTTSATWEAPKYRHRYRYMEIFYENLTHVIMEVKKSHDLASENCGPRKTGGIVPI